MAAHSRHMKYTTDKCGPDQTFNRVLHTVDRHPASTPQIEILVAYNRHLSLTATCFYQQHSDIAYSRHLYSVGLIEVRMSRAVDYLPDEFTKQATEDKLMHHGKKEKLLSFLGT